MHRRIATDEVDELLAAHVADQRAAIGTDATASAIQAAVATPDQVLYRNAFGTADPEASQPTPVDMTTPFDIASITKSLVGATLAMQAVDEGLVRWQTPVAELLPAWGEHSDSRGADATFLQLLNHTAGLADWHPFFEDYPVDPTPRQAQENFEAVIDDIVSMPLEGAPGAVHTYSDLGYILLTRIFERLFDRRVDELAQHRIFEPLGLQRTTYVPCDQPPLQRAVVTEDCPHRNRVISGTVHDTNTNVLGGLSTHAGVFSTADDLLTFARHLLAIDRGEPTDTAPLVTRETLQFGWSTAAGSHAGHHLAGWDTPSGENSSAGRGFHPDHTVGHLGFTGTSLWIERRLGIISVLLTNRVYPTRDNDRIKPLRIAFQERIVPPP